MTETEIVHSDGDDSRPAPIYVEATGITVTGPRGPVFENVSFEVADGAVAAVCGPGGSGRTSLLLTVAGRMRTAAGRLRVGGAVDPREIAEQASIAQAGPAFTLDEELRVRELIVERQLLHGEAFSADRLNALLEWLGVEHRRSDFVHSLPPAERTAIALALAAAEGSTMLIVDDLDAGCTADETEYLWSIVRELSSAGHTVFAGCSRPPKSVESRLIELPHPARRYPD